MTSAPSNSWLERVGETAGVIWRALDADGPMTVAKVVKAAAQPRDTVMLALGWLAAPFAGKGLGLFTVEFRMGNAIGIIAGDGAKLLGLFIARVRLK